MTRCNCGTFDHKHEPRCGDPYEIVTRKEWPLGLFCCACGEHIDFGEKVLWRYHHDYDESFCEDCTS